MTSSAPGCAKDPEASASSRRVDAPARRDRLRAVEAEALQLRCAVSGIAAKVVAEARHGLSIVRERAPPVVRVEDDGDAE
jgi:hypothetical protein